MILRDQVVGARNTVLHGITYFLARSFDPRIFYLVTYTDNRVASQPDNMMTIYPVPI